LDQQSDRFILSTCQIANAQSGDIKNAYLVGRAAPILQNLLLLGFVGLTGFGFVETQQISIPKQAVEIHSISFIYEKRAAF
jgi:hypothetical protein